MSMKYFIKYKFAGEVFTSTETETDYYSLDITENADRYTVILNPKRNFELIDFYAETDYQFDKNDWFFVGGYQSWTKSREYKNHHIQRGVSKLSKIHPLASHAAKLFGDQYIVDYSEIPGEFHSHCYTYIRNGKKVKLFGSLSEKTGFTYFKVKMNDNYFSIHKDVLGKFVTEAYTVFDIVYYEGTYDEVFDKYFAKFDMPETRKDLMTGYTSWYNYFQKIDEKIILRDLEGLNCAKNDVNIFQIDDGYETFVGDWLDHCEKFPNGMKYIAEKVHAKGYKAGIWIAPFSCQRVSRTAKEHPDWLIKDSKGKPQIGCIGWGGAYTLDIYNKEARDYIKHFFDVILNDWGYDMVKLDFLYSQCISPRNGKCRGEIMYDGMQLLRECVGDKLLLGCGIPMSAAIGVCDACRISCDVDLKYTGRIYNHIHVNNEMLSAQSAINNSIFRRHLNGRVFMNDPDVFFLRNHNLIFNWEQKHLLARINNLFGNVLFVSDNAGEFNKKQIEFLKKYFKKTGEVVKSAEYLDDEIIRIEIDDNGKDKVLEFNLVKGELIRDN